MKTLGLITEYNPFHNGHQYHIDQSKKLTNSDYVITIMSGDYVQRGTPAITDKYTRAKMALSCGSDMVIELPVRYACSSAEHFSFGAIATLNNSGIIDSICFGSEAGEIPSLSAISDIYQFEPPAFQATLTTLIRKGYSYPSARNLATLSQFPQEEQAEISKILSSPNNILGIEYLKALKHYNSDIKPYTIPRKGVGYHDTKISSLASATGIRSSYADHQTISLLRSCLPEAAYRILSEAEKHTFPITEDDFSDLLYFSLLYKNSSLSRFADVSSDLADRIKNHLSSFTSFHDFSVQIKTKQYTHTRVMRALLHILLDIQDTPLPRNNTSIETAPYIRVLGIKKESSPLLKQMKNNACVPVITKLSQDEKLLNPQAFHMLQEDILATHLYNRVVYSKFHFSLPNEYQQGLLVLK